MTACVFAWEKRAEDSSRFMLGQMRSHTSKWVD
jgi:hypothetical protein